MLNVMKLLFPVRKKRQYVGNIDFIKIIRKGTSIKIASSKAIQNTI